MENRLKEEFKNEEMAKLEKREKRNAERKRPWGYFYFFVIFVVLGESLDLFMDIPVSQRHGFDWWGAVFLGIGLPIFGLYYMVFKYYKKDSRGLKFEEVLWSSLLFIWLFAMGGSLSTLTGSKMYSLDWWGVTSIGVFGVIVLLYLLFSNKED